MKALIIYFSQTGNTKVIANNIQAGILNSGNECDITSIKDVDISMLNNYNIIGFGTPTFFYREPANVQRFIEKMNMMEGKHCFLFCTHGSIIGNTLYYLNDGLRKKGLQVIGTFDTYSESSIQFYPEIMHTAGHPDEIELNDAFEFGKTICEISSRIQEGESGLVPKFELISNTWWAEHSKRLTPDVLRTISPEFTVNFDKCTKCFVCQENCPVDAIDLEASPPVIQKEGCISCWYCEKSCPEGAIEADWSQMKKKSRENLLKYIEALKEAEKAGKFRPYVDYEKII